MPWLDAEVKTLDILLDVKNPRIPIKAGATQEEIRNQLLEEEDILGLADGIIKHNGLLPGERIIVCVEDNQNIVLEGNRRVTACQFLLNRTLIPSEFSGKFPSCDDENILDNIRLIKADVAPTREDAEPVITQRHTERGIRPWSLMANIRRIQGLIQQGRSLDETLRVHGITKVTYKKYLRQYELFKFVQEMAGWTNHEREFLRHFKGNLSPFTTFFTRRGVTKKLELTFDDLERPHSTLPNKTFHKYMAFIATCFLFNEEGKNKPRANSRTTPEELFSWLGDSTQLANIRSMSVDPILSNPLGSSNDTNRSTDVNVGNENIGQDAYRKQDEIKPIDSLPVVPQKEFVDLNDQPPKAAKFFENIVCHIDDNHLISLTKEINMINYKKYPIAATMLLRALLEASLSYQLIKKGVWSDLVQKKQGGDLNLNLIIRYCQDRTNNVFIERRACDTLRVFDNNYKEYLDFVVHVKWAEADSRTLEQMANMIRPLLVYILSDEREKFRK